jgi:rhodanese-related sulfurtransferase/glyoxylase-like metal-dependent hydrolase (beta-lactamase superfamily II)
VNIVPVVDEGLGNSSYVVDLGDGGALVIDPERNPTPYLEEADRRGLKIRFTAETHLHADFVSGSRELAAEGARVLAPAAAQLEFPHTGLEPDAELDVGGLTLRTLPTPGHTPEHVAYLFADGERPVALFSGGSLLVGAAARTDLIDPDETEALSRAMFTSLQQLMRLPDDTPVYPTHGAGSFCSVAGGVDRTTTVGRERVSNPLLQIEDEDAFVQALVAGFGTFPTYFGRLRPVNRTGPRVYGSHLELPELTVRQVTALIDEGATVVDARPIDSFARGHIPGALSIQLRPSFASWLGWLIDDRSPLVVVLEDGQDRTDLVAQALKVGYENLVGELAGGMDAWAVAGLDVIEAFVLAPDRVPSDAMILDVRQETEYEAGHIPGSLHVELGALPAVAADLAHERGPVVVVCGHGERSMTGVSILQAAGSPAAANLIGGTGAWRSAGRPWERG